jgi:hypothetical protein
MSTDEPDDRASDEVDTMAYAVSFLQAAERLADTEWEGNHAFVVPFYALIGFALENGLKAALEHRAVDRSLKWSHSHDLQKLRDLTRKEGLYLVPNADALIDSLAVHHKEHHFRYPQKARQVELTKPSTVVILTDAVLRMVFDFIDGHARIGE